MRVVVDIGLHLGLTVPPGHGELSGRTVDPSMAVELLVGRALLDRPFAESEVDRYLGIPGQAISYKVGEKVWLESRAEVQRRMGAAFNLKDFHMAALNLGPMGLAQLRTELERLGDRDIGRETYTTER